MNLNPLRWLAKMAASIGRYNYSAYERLSQPFVPRSTDVGSLLKHNRSWVYICATRNAETVAGQHLRLYVRGGSRKYYERRALTAQQKGYVERATAKSAEVVEEVVADHPLVDLLDYVNGEHTRAELMEATTLWLEITGDAYWYLEPGPLDTVKSIWPLSSQYMRVVRDSQGELAGYLYGKSSTDRIALDPRDVVHFKTANPGSNDYGLSPLEAAFGAAVLLESQQQYEQSIYDGGGVPEVGLLVKGDISAEERKRMYAEWRQKFASKKAGDKFIILEGDCDIKTFGLPPKDVGVQFSQKFCREEVAAAFGVPMTLIEIQQAARAGAEAGNYAYMQHTIAPKLRRIAEKMTEQLCSRFDDRLFVLFDDPVPADQEYRLKQLEVRLRSKMTTVNEERALDGFPPVPWGDEPVQSPQAANPFMLTAHDHEHKALPPLSSSERRFSRAVEGYLRDYRTETVRRLREVIE